LQKEEKFILTFELTIAGLILEEIKEIIEECASGNVRAQEKLYRMFAPKMFGVCLRYSKDRNEAEDNLQEGFVNVFLNIGSFRFEGSFEGWIRRIMVNVALGKYRKNNLLYPVEDIGNYEMPDFSDGIYEKFGADELISLIQELPERYRMVFNLYVMEGMNHQEISEIMNISVGTSKSNLSRARDILKRKVNELYKEVELKNNLPA
jgi:RNA polymerase sigma-70 factor (ECF subfamily)